MSVKKRLFWSHILMFALPMAVYLLVSLLADRISWLWLLQQRFTSMADLEHAMRRGTSPNMHILYLKNHAGYDVDKSKTGREEPSLPEGPVVFVGEEEIPD